MIKIFLHFNHDVPFRLDQTALSWNVEKNVEIGTVQRQGVNKDLFLLILLKEHWLSLKFKLN